MVQVTFRTSTGAVFKIEATVGGSLMSSAKAKGVPGIDADCGGSMVCGTCHVFVDPPWLERLPPPSAGEADLVEYGLHPQANSRLSCQIIATEDLAGMTLEIPPAQK